MEKTLYIDNSKYSVEVSSFDWHQSQNEIQCIMIFLSAADKMRFLREVEEIYEYMQLDEMRISNHWYEDIKNTQAVVFCAYYSVPSSDDFKKEEQSLCEAFGFNPAEVIF